MISLYSGTPGSGKSYHVANVRQSRLRFRHTSIGNFPVNNYKHYKGEYIYCRNEELTPKYLIDYSKEYFKTHRFCEGAILLLIDEAQLLFNSRDFMRNDRMEWISFFTQHRHLVY